MYQREFDALLQKQLPKAVLLYGKNPYMIEYYVRFYMRSLQAEDNALRLYFEEYRFDTAKGYLSQNSLFGGENLLIVKNDKKIPKKELESLVALTQKNNASYFLFVFYGPDKDAKALQSAFHEKKGGAWVRFFDPTPQEALTLTLRYAQQNNIQIGRNELLLLLESVHFDIQAGINELNKIAISHQVITSDTIKHYVFSTSLLSIEEILFLLFKKESVNVPLAKALEAGEDPFSILRSIQYFLQRLFLFQAYIKLHGKLDSAQVLGYKLPRKVEDRYTQLALRIKPATLLKAYNHLIQSEIALKEAPSSQKESLLFGCVVGLQSVLV